MAGIVTVTLPPKNALLDNGFIVRIDKRYTSTDNLYI